jgi:hypothetical protein
MKKYETNIYQPFNSKDGISIHAYRGDGMVLLGFNFDAKPDAKFAGFAIKRKSPGGKSDYLMNRLSFSQAYTKGTTPEQRIWTPSNEAPFQKFMWLDVPPDPQKGIYNYEVTAMFNNGSNPLKEGPKTDVDIELIHDDEDKFFEIGFTRGYASSQAYADKFGNKDIRPAKKSLDYPYKKYEAQYSWLGYNAHEMVFRFLSEALNDKDTTLDVFAYDFDEPEIIKELAKLGKRLRIILDNSKTHVAANALEKKAKVIVTKSAGKDNVTAGHFTRFSHDKIFILKKNGKAYKVLTGSANFSIRGLYIQANNVIIINDSGTAELYGQVFDAVFSQFKAAEQKKKSGINFKKSELSGKWFQFDNANIPDFFVSFAPHSDANISLQKVEDEIASANESVFYAIMDIKGGGDVLKAIRNLATGDKDKVFTYGVSQTPGGITLYKPGRTDGIFASFSYLTSKVPKPFRQEWSGGMGQVIHHKFIVKDFKSDKPVVFTGSSNLASGGETNNGDNMLAIYDSRIALAYGIEAFRLADHYNFRTSMKTATKVNPLMLRTDEWFSDYFTESTIKFRERELFK